MRLERLTLALFLLCVPLLATGRAMAQSDTEQSPEIQRIFEEGTAALREGHFRQARDLLRRVHASEAQVGSAFNLAVALRGTGETIECEAILDRLLEGVFGEITDSVRELSEQVHEGCSAENSTLEIEVTGVAGATVTLDGEDIGELDLGQRLERRVPPGSHHLEASRDGYTSAEASVVLGRGETILTRLTPEPAVPVALAVQAPQPTEVRGAPIEEAPSPVTTEAWFWVVLVGAVALVGGAIALGLVLAPSAVADPVPTAWAPVQFIP